MNLSVVIPVLDEAKCLGPFLEMLAAPPAARHSAIRHMAVCSC